MTQQQIIGHGLIMNGFTVLPDPQLNSITPSIGLQGQQLSVSISGSGAQFTNYSGTQGNLGLFHKEIRFMELQIMGRRTTII